jgi:Protein of unknown function (DUF732)
MWRFGHRDKGVDVRDDGPMRRPLAVLFAAVALCVGATVQANPGRADPGLDASFLDALTKAGITVKDGPGAVKAGKVACGLIAQGRPEIEVVDQVSRQNPGLDTTRAAQFTALATSAYCPQYLQRPTAPPSAVGGATTTAPGNG